MRGVLLIAAVLVAAVAAVTAFGPSCHSFEGIQDVCIGQSGKRGALVVAIAAAAVAVWSMLPQNRRRR